MNGTSAEYQHSIPQRVILISLACLLTLVASLSLRCQIDKKILFRPFSHRIDRNTHIYLLNWVLNIYSCAVLDQTKVITSLDRYENGWF